MVRCPKDYSSNTTCSNYIYRCLDCGREFCRCPRCGGYNCDRQNGIWYCYDCGHEFGAPKSS